MPLNKESVEADKSGTDRRGFLKASALAAGGLLLPGWRGRWAGGARHRRYRPNIILFLTDDQAYDETGYGGSGVLTPNIDHMAANGMVYSAAYCSAILCIPSRACIMSGLHHHRSPTQQLGILYGLKEGSWTWARALQARGYRTGLIGKMHFQPMRSEHGFEVQLHSENKLNWEIREANDHFDDHFLWLEQQGVVSLPDYQPRGQLLEDATWLVPETPRATAMSWKYDSQYHAISWIRERAIEFLRQQSQDERPYCLLISIKYPHPPYVPAPPFDTMYSPDEVDLPTEWWNGMVNIPQEVIDAGNKRLFGIVPTWYHRGVQWFCEMVAAYRGIVSQIDQAVGDIMEYVDPRDTLCFLTADHGDYMGRRGRVYKIPLIPFDAIARVPFIAYGCGVPAGTVCNQAVSLVDLAPTFLTAANMYVPEDLDGTPLQNFFSNPAHDAKRPVYCFGKDGFDMVRRGRWKYFRSPLTATELLFDMEFDPGEWMNLADDPTLQSEKEALSVEMDAVFAKPNPRFECRLGGRDRGALRARLRRSREASGARACRVIAGRRSRGPTRRSPHRQ